MIPQGRRADRGIWRRRLTLEVPDTIFDTTYGTWVLHDIYHFFDPCWRKPTATNVKTCYNMAVKVDFTSSDKWCWTCSLTKSHWRRLLWRNCHPGKKCCAKWERERTRSRNDTHGWCLGKAKGCGKVSTTSFVKLFHIVNDRKTWSPYCKKPTLKTKTWKTAWRIGNRNLRPCSRSTWSCCGVCCEAYRARQVEELCQACNVCTTAKHNNNVKCNTNRKCNTITAKCNYLSNRICNTF